MNVSVNCSVKLMVNSARVSLVAAVAVCGLALSGCPPIATDIPSHSDVNVPGQGILGGNPLLPAQAFPADAIGKALADSIKQSFDTSGYDKSHVSSLKLTSLTLTVTTPDENGQQVRDLSFLSKLTVSLAGIKVAESGDGDFGAKPTTYAMPMTNAEIAEAFKKADTLELTADVVPGNPPRLNTAVSIDSNVHAEISVF